MVSGTGSGGIVGAVEAVDDAAAVDANVGKFSGSGLPIPARASAIIFLALSRNFLCLSSSFSF